MKFLLTILLATCVLSDPIVSDLNEDTRALMFLKGFVNGIGESGKPETLLKCMKDIDAIIIGVQTALGLLKYLDIKSITDGLTILFRTMTDLFTALQPCSEGFSIMKKLSAAIYDADLRKLSRRIVMNPGNFVQEVNTALDCLVGGVLNCTGQGVGQILTGILL